MRDSRKRIIHDTPQEILAEWENNLNFEIIARYNLFFDVESIFSPVFIKPDCMKRDHLNLSLYSLLLA